MITFSSGDDAFKFFWSLLSRFLYFSKNHRYSPHKIFFIPPRFAIMQTSQFAVFPLLMTSLRAPFSVTVVVVIKCGLVSFHAALISPHIISTPIHFTPRSFHPTFKLSNASRINNYCMAISILELKEKRVL